MFFDELEAGFTDPSTIEEKKQRYMLKPDAATAKSLATYFQTQSEIKTAVNYFNEAVKLDPESDYSSELFELYNSGYHRDVYSLEELISIAEQVLASKKAGEDHKINVYADMAGYLKDDPDNKRLKSYTTTGYDYLKNNSENAPRWAVNSINLNYALYIEKDFEKAVTIRKNNMKTGWENNSSQLNGFAWWCFENKVNLEEAAELGRRGIKLASPGREKAMILDTVAEIENLRGNPGEAVTLMEEAVKEDPGVEAWQKQLQRFKKEVKKT
jgi:tetratricopeptide (TPR) repeat protein